MVTAETVFLFPSLPFTVRDFRHTRKKARGPGNDHKEEFKIEKKQNKKLGAKERLDKISSLLILSQNISVKFPL